MQCNNNNITKTKAKTKTKTKTNTNKRPKPLPNQNQILMSPDLCLSLAELVWIIIIAYNSNITMNIDMCFCGAFEQWTNQNGQQWVYTTASIKWQCGITYIHFPKTSQEEIRAYVPKFSFLHWIKRCKEPSCPRSPGLGFWRTLEVPDWGFGSWLWWGWV